MPSDAAIRFTVKQLDLFFGKPSRVGQVKPMMNEAREYQRGNIVAICYVLKNRCGRIHYVKRNGKEMSWRLQDDLLALNRGSSTWGPREMLQNGLGYIWKRKDGLAHATYDRRRRMMAFFTPEYEQALESYDDR